MLCAKDFCEIYRDKKYCSRIDKQEDYNKSCSCRHAKYACQVGVVCGLGELHKCSGPIMIEALQARVENSNKEIGQ